MSQDLFLVSDGKKFMWDGQNRETGDDAAQVAEAYAKEGFEVRTVMAGGKFLVYTRRVAKAVVAAAN